MCNARWAEQCFRQRIEPQDFWCGAGSLALLLCLGAGAARAAEAAPNAAVPSWLQLETDLSVDREVIDTRWSSVVRAPSSAPDYSLAGGRALAVWVGLDQIPAFVELSPAHMGNDSQVTYRPQLVLGGGASESLRSWLGVVGINATSCTAPLMRMHSGFADSSVHANISVSARCSFR